MWFRMPQGCENISVELQAFRCEFTDKKGNGYFRAPDHFATKILSIGGFVALERAPEGSDLEDLPKADPLRDGAISELTKTVEAQKAEIQNLRSDAAANNAKLIALTNENTDLKKSVATKELRITQLEEQVEDLPNPPAEAGKKK